MDFIQQIKVFLAVADQGSFARAAEALGITRPSVTNTIHALEDVVGARLFQRTTRRTSLSPEGQSFYANAIQVLESVEKARNLFGLSKSTPPRGRLRVDMTNSIAKPIVIPRLKEFIEAFPEIELTLGVSDHMVDLIADGVDCVLRVGQPADSSMVGRVVGHVTILSCASSDYVRAHGKLRKLSELVRHQVLLYFSGRDKKVMNLNLDDEQEGAGRTRPALLVNDHEALVACAMNGLGIAQLVGAAVHEELTSGRLIEVLPQEYRSTLPVSVMYPARQHLSPQVRAFVDWIATVFSTHEGKWIKGA